MGLELAVALFCTFLFQKFMDMNMLIHQVSITKNNGQVSTCHTFTHLSVTRAIPKVTSERKRKAAVLSINQGSKILK